MEKILTRTSKYLAIQLQEYVIPPAPALWLACVLVLARVLDGGVDETA